MATAPVCNIQPIPPPITPLPKSTPAIPAPAANLSSLLASVAALKLAVEQLQLQQSGGGTTLTTTPPKKPVPNAPTWVELSRVTKTVRVFNPQDSSQFVDVLQITKLTMQDQSTGQLWVWSQ